MWTARTDEMRVRAVGVDGVGADGVGVDEVGGGDAAQKATDAAEEEGATKVVAVETKESMEQNLDLAPGETTPSRKSPTIVPGAPLQRRRRRRGERTLTCTYTTMRRALAGSSCRHPWRMCRPPPPARPRRWTGVRRETNHFLSSSAQKKEYL
jgi:hypothetical protein